MSLTIKVFLGTPTSVGANWDIPFKIMNGTNKPTAATSRFRVKATAYNEECSVRVGVVPAFGASDELSLRVEVKGSANLENLPRVQTYELFDEQSGAVLVSQNITNDMFSFNALLDCIAPPAGVSNLTVLVMGPPGSGKSALLNTFKLVMTQGTGEKGRTVPVGSIAAGGGSEHVTTDLQGYKDICKHAQFIDPWGLDKKYEDPETIDFMLDGKLPFGWKMDMHLMDYVKQFEAHAAFAKERRVHAIIFMIPIGYLKSEHLSKQLIEYFRRTKARGYNPILLLARADEAYATLRANPMEPPKELKDEIANAARTFDIPLNNVTYAVPYNGESTRVFDLERLAYKCMHMALLSAKEFAIRHCSKVPSPSKVQLDWGAPPSYKP